MYEHKNNLCKYMSVLRNFTYMYIRSISSGLMSYRKLGMSAQQQLVSGHQSMAMENVSEESDTKYRDHDDIHEWKS